jgi:DUF2075 family protein
MSMGLYEDDCALNAWEWHHWLDECEALDQIASTYGERTDVHVIILADAVMHFRKDDWSLVLDLSDHYQNCEI